MEVVKIISKRIVEKNLTFTELIPYIREALKEFSAKPSHNPGRTAIWANESRRYFVLPSFSMRENLFTTKILSVFPDCEERGLPVRNSYLIILNEDDGTLKCIMESEIISYMRTAAATVVATQAVVKQNPKVLGVLGSGNQAVYHIRAFCETYELEKILVWSRSKSNVDNLCKRLDSHGISVSACQSAKEAVTNADVVVTATSSSIPVVKGAWLKPDCHVNVIGAIHPAWREVDDECMEGAVVYVDSVESAQKEAGDIIMTKVPIYAEIGEVLLGEKLPKYGKRTIFKSMGIGVEDTYAAKLVLNKLQDERESDE